MHVTLTIKLAAESKGELVDTFALQCTDLRKQIEQIIAVGWFGDPAKVDLRMLVVCGRWETPAAS
jgi:hypothetical protein